MCECFRGVDQECVPQSPNPAKSGCQSEAWTRQSEGLTPEHQCLCTSQNRV